MVDFRRCITALAVLALFAGLAVAQTGINNPLSCVTNVSVTPTLRGEGYTEQTGDVTLVCTGGVAPAIGQPIPTANFTVFYNTSVTSRLLGSNNVSEALLLIDEPGSLLTPVVPGFGPAAAQNVCNNPLGVSTNTTCQQFVSQATTATGNFLVATDGSGTTFTPSGTAATNTRNVFQGVVNSNNTSVTFFGIPILAPGTTASRTFRITNVRVNATSLTGGSASGATPVSANISISGATSLSITNPSPTVGFVTNGLSAKFSTSTQTFAQCAATTKATVGLINFSENFGTAFKTRVSAIGTGSGSYAGQGTNTPTGQNVPGQNYQSESNLIIPIPNGGVAGLADFGTRLKASFNNIAPGVHIFVSVFNVANSITPIVQPTTPGTPGNNSFAQLVSSETASDAGSNTLSGFFPAVSATDNATGTVGIFEVPISNGSGQAVWEVISTNPNATETFSFGVYITYSPNPGQNTPAQGQSTLALSFAPSPTSAFSASSGPFASGSLPIPRFIGDTTTPGRNLFLIQICRTILLYPYITNQAGFDTGISIANTTLDPFTTGSNTTVAQSGTCSLNWYGGTTTAPTTAPGPSAVASIAGGTIYVNTAQTLVPNFQGYMIAICNFQFAHGFAFVSDVGARNLAMGYLAVVLDDPGAGARTPHLTVGTENGAH